MHSRSSRTMLQHCTPGSRGSQIVKPCNTRLHLSGPVTSKQHGPQPNWAVMRQLVSRTQTDHLWNFYFWNLIFFNSHAAKNIAHTMTYLYVNWKARVPCSFELDYQSQMMLQCQRHSGSHVHCKMVVCRKGCDTQHWLLLLTTNQNDTRQFRWHRMTFKIIGIYSKLVVSSWQITRSHSSARVL